MTLDSERNPIKQENRDQACDEINEVLNNINLTKKTYYENVNYSYNFFRNLIIVIDFSENMNLNDYKPTRHKFLFHKLESLINNFFKYNFISSITIVSMKNYLSNIVSSINNDPHSILENLNKDKEPEGFPSIYNALNLCAEYSNLLERSKVDIVFFYSSLTTFDKGNTLDLLDYFIDEKIEINFFTFDTPFDLLYVNILNNF